MRRLYNYFASTIEKHFRIDAHYFLKGGFWLLVAQGATILSSLVVAVFFARYLSEADYGVYRYIIGLAALLGSFSLTGIGQTVLQASSRGYNDFLRASTPLTLKWSSGIFLLSLTGTVYYATQDNRTLAIGCLLIAVLHPVSQLFSNTLSHLYGKSKFQSGSLTQALKSVFVSGASLVSIFLTENILILLTVYFATQAMVTIICYLWYRPKEVSQTSIPPEVWNKYIHYAKHTSYRNLIIGIAMRLDTVIIFQIIGATQLALYSIATLIPDQIRGGVKNLQTLLIPRYSKHDSIDTLKHSILKRSFQSFGILTVITIVTIVLTPLIYPLLFPKYLDAIPYVQLLALTFPASIFLLPLGALQAHHKEKELYTYHLITSLVQISTLGIFVLKFGLIGAIISKIVTLYSCTLIAYTLLFRRKS